MLAEKDSSSVCQCRSNGSQGKAANDRLSQSTKLRNGHPPPHPGVAGIGV
ncbi:hypothetical protein [Oryzomonas japonica]|nr:hypothetical protein [Oryzomonas japonica]